MQIVKTHIEGLVEIIPAVFKDERGYFFESFHEKKIAECTGGAKFVQDNQSFSTKGVLRGLHFQLPPFAQGKLVRVISGKVIDVAVDLRKSSPTFGQHYTCLLDSERNNMLYVPEGFAHGFAVLEDAVFFYKCTNYYNKASESGIIWNDPTLNIDWGINNAIVSAKDEELLAFDKVANSFA